MGKRVFAGGYAGREEGGLRLLEKEGGSWSCVRVFSGLENPSFLLRHPKHPVLYTVEELSPAGRLAAFAIEGDKLRKLCAMPSMGADPCHISLNEAGDVLFVSNYGSGSIAAFRLDENGVPAEGPSLVRHEKAGGLLPGQHPARQALPHVHCTASLNGLVLACDLGMDMVSVYRWEPERGELLAAGDALCLPHGSGPRHLAVSPDGAPFVYVICEMKPEVHVFANGENGWREIQTIQATAPGFADTSPNGAVGAAIHWINPERLCVSCRVEDSVTIFSRRPDGKLDFVQRIHTGGRTPRDFRSVGDELLIANQDSGEIRIFALDASGIFVNTGERMSADKPACICPI